MKKFTQILFAMVVLLCSAVASSQSTITGTIIDGEMNSPLPGANIVQQGTTNGTTTTFEGDFTLQTNVSSGKFVVSYVGYSTITLDFNGDQDFGQIKLMPDNTLDEIVIVGSGVIDLAEDRKTPVAVSTIRSQEIQEKAGNWDLPEVLKSTPSIQNVKGGAFGDGTMFVRGFDQTNTAFLLNGQPINGMEDGKMYWSNWSGVMDVANAIQVQRGLGASKLAISSVGGTVNIVTKTIDKKEGGYLQQMLGNDYYTKTTAYYSTGVSEKGWSFSSLLGYWQGDGYVNDTDGQGQTYFFSVGYTPNDHHSLNFLLTGAPQWHAVAGSGDIQSFLDNGREYNSWSFDGVDSPNTLSSGKYPGGRNIYHKPVANLSWDWTINDQSSMSTVLYGSLGRGSFAQSIGSVDYARGSNNNHDWYGLVTNYNNQLTENLNFNVGADVRLYSGYHFRDVREFITVDSVTNSSGYSGGQDYQLTEAGGINPWKVFFNPNTDHLQRFGYDYSEQINYGGVFGQLEYAKDGFSAFFQGALSTQSHVRTEFLNTSTPGEGEEGDKVNNPGFNVKGGLAYELSQAHRVFFNTGYYSRQPFHDTLYQNDRAGNELLQPEAENEEITGFELGYQFMAGRAFSANLNGYHTTWDNVTKYRNNGENGDDYISYQTMGVKQVHYGVELEVMTRPLDNLRLNGFLSLGEWQFKDNANQRTFDNDGNQIGADEEIVIDGYSVGGAAQVTGGINGSYDICSNFSVDAAWNWYNDMFSIGALDQAPLSMPSYDTMDAGLSYKVMVGSNESLQFRFNLNNVFDEVYLESVSGNTAASANPDENYKGINTSNNGRFGYGRTWNFSVRFNF
ncbi:carboxypeptidase-like regulatory domain-containing protein [Tamlana sp. 2_MG-2023]|uniref:TonB-dependent receptor n=1 Tax=unclassified Tamlana TaxID=2614803 RepID=UPI0026E1D26F|nr:MULTISPECIES: carboxypeptidase-like regulatory domain-containing protein [unclassified Tamlana]MDO6760522.1 carboxypeptidase-like regulatory domain-containing protein [Tamlana sp. 2_MG-2023]MDO6790778.1 carboxypeptidase-like regulatory domain-containing protein [Tamlana sp. 1_MG-2023]